MTNAKNDRRSTHTESTPEYVTPPAPSRAAMTIRSTLAALLTFIAGPYLWARAVVICIFMDFRLKQAPWLGGFVLLIVIVAALMYGLDAGDRLRRFRWRSVVMLFVIWISIGAAIVLLATSPFTERIQFIPIYVLSTLWMLWLWIMPMTALRRSVQWAVFVLLLLCAPAFPVLITFDGVDGDSRPITTWRFAVHESPSATDMVPWRLASTSSQPDIADIPSFPQFLGPNRNGVITDTNLSNDLDTYPPREKWRNKIGLGWGGFATQANRAITQEQRGKKEMVVCYDIHTGHTLWVHTDDDDIDYHNRGTGDGPRATPTIVDGCVYTVGVTGNLNCLELSSGKRLWSVNILKDSNTENTLYGQSGSPLVVDQMVIVSPGGGNGRSLVAYEKRTGKVVWQSGNDDGGYGSPTLMTIADTRQILMYNATGVSAHDVETGTILWTHPWQNYKKVNCTQPVLVAEGENRVLLSTAYGKGSCLIEVSKADDNSFAVKQLWMNRELRVYFSSIVVRENYAYGLYNGILVCIDLAAGKRKWKNGRYGHGQVLLADDLLIIQAEKGEVAFVKASPEAYSELHRMKALRSKTWNNPALAGRFLLVRNDREAVCYELSQKL